MGIDDDSDDFNSELIEVLVTLVRIVSRMRMLQAQDDPTIAALLARAHVVLSKLTDITKLNEPITRQ